MKSVTQQTMIVVQKLVTKNKITNDKQKHFIEQGNL
jgi:hypothetical protein